MVLRMLHVLPAPGVAQRCFAAGTCLTEVCIFVSAALAAAVSTYKTYLCLRRTSTVLFLTGSDEA